VRSQGGNLKSSSSSKYPAQISRPFDCWIKFFASSFAIKPVRNLEVVCRNQVYEISDVSTVDELVDKLQRDSSISRQDIESCKVIYKGNVLEKKTSLRKAGIKDGSSVIVVTDNYKLKGKEALAIFLEMINEESWERLNTQMKERGDGFDVDSFRELWKDSQYIKRQQVSDALRNSLDVSYRMLRGGWEHPAFRRALHDVERIEAYRQVVDKVRHHDVMISCETNDSKTERDSRKD
jgi:uncharacterized ubiquitin-like protein YukD